MIQFIFAYILLNGIILSAIYFYRNNNYFAAKYFFFLLFVELITLFEHLSIHYIIQRFNWFLMPGFPVRFLFGPLLFLYVSYYLNPDYKPSTKTKLLVWLPTIIDVLAFIAMSIWGATHHYTLAERYTILNGWPFILESGLAVPYSIFFTVKSYLTIQKFYRNQKEIYTNIKFKNFSWLLYIVLVTILLQLIWLVYIIIDIAVNLPRKAYDFLTLLTGIQVLVYGYLAILKPENTLYFRATNNDFKKLLPEFSNEEKYKPEVEIIQDQQEIIEDEVLPPELYKDNYSQLLFNKIDLWMQEEKPYKKPDFSLSDIVEKFKIKSSLISLALKEGSATNFYNYVNTLRAQEFLSELTDPENKIYTITALGQRAGFTSKATLLKYFKNLTDLTPSEYLAQNNNLRAATVAN